PRTGKLPAFVIEKRRGGWIRLGSQTPQDRVSGFLIVESNRSRGVEADDLRLSAEARQGLVAKPQVGRGDQRPAGNWGHHGASQANQQEEPGPKCAYTPQFQEFPRVRTERASRSSWELTLS